jgi:hypothetical protein
MLPCATHPVSVSLRFSNSLPSFFAVTQLFQINFLQPTAFSSLFSGRGDVNALSTITWKTRNKHTTA